MASKDLYDLVSKTIQDGDNKISKVQIGYTVDSYKSVLSALQKAQAQMSKSEPISDGYIVRNPIFARWTEMSSINLGGVVNQADGFVVDGSGNYETYRQQRVKFLPFMTFVVRVKDENGEMKPHIASFDSHIETLNRGESIALGGKVAYPPKDIDENSCSSIAMAVGGMSNSCEIGIAVDLTEGTGTPDVFFQKCYPKVYKEGIGGKLASRRALMAEIAFVGGNKANTLHARVIANSGNTPSGSVHNAYIPIPLLLTNEYMTLADVEINIGQLVRIGTSDCDYPFKDSNFNHKNCSLDGFTPQYFKDIIKNKLSVADTKVKFASASQGDNFGYIRFYIDKEKEAQISDCLAIDIPEEYKVEIFKGIGEADIAEKVIGYETGTTSYAFAIGVGAAAQGMKTDSAFYTEGQIDWVAFRKKHPNLPQGHEEIIEQIAKQYNINTRMWLTQIGLETGWFTSKNFKTRKNPGGISASSQYKGGEVYTLSYLGGVRAKRDIEVRGEGYGHYWIFETFEDGYRAMAHLLVNSSRYGLGRFGAQTVYEHFTNMYKGGYCDLREAVCQNYNDKLMNQYANII